ncbi:MAG: recombinase family protein [Bacteroidia bacterium]
MITKFFLYARKSSEAEEKQAMSIEAQLHELTELANRENLTIIETFIESKSAKTPGRKEFARMIEKIHDSKEPVGILAWHPDRLARNSIDGGQIIYLIDTEKVCALRFSTFWFEPTPQGLFMLQVAFGQSKYYSDNLSENVKRGIRQKLRRGEFYGIAPLGYVNNPITRNIEPEPIKSKIVQRVFKEYAEGKHTLDSLRERLKFLGIVSKNNSPVARSFVQRMLSNIAYLGIIKLNEETHEGNFKPLIDRATFETVQRILKQRGKPMKSKKSHSFPFLGLFKCGECGAAITAQYAKGAHGGLYRYYRCSKRIKKCGQGYLREDRFISALGEEFQKVALPNEWAEKMLAQIETWGKQYDIDARSFAQNIEKEIKDTDQKLDKLVNAFLDAVIDQKAYLKKKEELIKLKTELNKKKEDFGQKGAFWNEPLREWVNTAHNAGKLALSEDYSQIKSFAEKIGTNRQLLDKKMLFEVAPPFSFISKYKGLETTSTAIAVLEEEGDMELSPLWYPRRDLNPYDC